MLLAYRKGSIFRFSGDVPGIKFLALADDFAIFREILMVTYQLLHACR